MYVLYAQFTSGPHYPQNGVLFVNLSIVIITTCEYEIVKSYVLIRFYDISMPQGIYIATRILILMLTLTLLLYSSAAYCTVNSKC